MKLAPGIALLLGTAVAGSANARPIHYNAVDNDALATCDAAEWRGQANDAERCYQELLASDSPTAIRAEAAWALGDLHAANRLFQSASRQTQNDPVLLTRWGDLYADTHNDAEAMSLYNEALAADSGYAYAQLGAARLLAGSFSEAANQYLEPLLSNSTLPAGARVGAWLLVARRAIENEQIGDAESHLDEAARLIDQESFPPLELYAMRAAQNLVDGGDGQPWVDRALNHHPNWGQIYATLAHLRVITRRYRDAIDYYQMAVDVDPELADAHEQMGVNLLRDNQVARARRHLEAAHDLDPFSPIAVNTLRLLDSFSRFPLIQDPAEPTPDGPLPIILRLRDDEASAIAPYAIDMTRRAIEVFTERYEFELSEPVVIEMYPDHEDFAVRTAGMPGIGILGATFGYVIAMDSPSARPPNEFQWGTTLWHELAHVFTLEASDHLVPRWFSEGVSVFEEWQTGPTPGVRIPLSVLAAMADDKFLPVADLDQGFMRPTYDNQVIVSYMQAGLICQYVDDHYGGDRLAAMLRAFADGADTREAFEQVLDISTSTFDRGFTEWLDQHFGERLSTLDDWQQLQTHAAEAIANDNWPAVIENAEALLELTPGYAEPDSPWLMLARAYRESEQTDQEIAALASFYQAGGFEADALTRYADHLESTGDVDSAIDVLMTVAMVRPLDTELHESLGELLLAAGAPRRALDALNIALARDVHDKANTYFQMARAHRALGNADATRDSLLQALDIAPGYRDAQRMLLDVMRDTVN